jgi:hypothetical protein
MKTIPWIAVLAMGSCCALASVEEPIEERAYQLDGVPIGSVPFQEPGEGHRLKAAGQVIYDTAGDAVRVGRWSEWSAKGESLTVGWYVAGKKEGDWMTFELIGTAYDPTGYVRWRQGVIEKTVSLKP